MPATAGNKSPKMIKELRSFKGLKEDDRKQVLFYNGKMHEGMTFF
jgi:hypothetical protein